MGVIETLALIRLVIVVPAIFFVARGKYWLLLAFLVCIGAIQVCSIVGTGREVVSAMATPVYVLIVLHALDISRRRHPFR